MRIMLGLQYFIIISTATTNCYIFLQLTVTMKVLVLCALVAGAMSALVEFRDKDIFEPLSDEMIWFINKLNTTWKVIMKILFLISHQGLQFKQKLPG